MTEDTLSVVSQYRPDLARAPKSVFKDKDIVFETITRMDMNGSGIKIILLLIRLCHSSLAQLSQSAV